MGAGFRLGAGIATSADASRRDLAYVSAQVKCFDPWMTLVRFGYVAAARSKKEMGVKAA